MISELDKAAITMLRAAGIRSSAQAVVLLADDLASVADEQVADDAGSEREATVAKVTLLSRIGGYSNLKSYMATLKAGRDRELSIPRKW
jgi:hypothetical protein